MTAAEIIDQIGGAMAVSRALNLPSTTVSNWRARNSIPAKWHRAVLAVGDGKVTAEQIVNAHAAVQGAEVAA